MVDTNGLCDSAVKTIFSNFDSNVNLLLTYMLGRTTTCAVGISFSFSSPRVKRCSSRFCSRTLVFPHIYYWCLWWHIRCCFYIHGEVFTLNCCSCTLLYLFFNINLEYHKYQRLHDIDVFLLILTTSVIDTFPIFSRHPWGGGSKACDGLCPRWLVHRRHRQHDGWQRSGKLRQRHCHHPQLPARSTG